MTLSDHQQGGISAVSVRDFAPSSGKEQAYWTDFELCLSTLDSITSTTRSPNCGRIDFTLTTFSVYEDDP
jgi:hypothetical protein